MTKIYQLYERIVDGNKRYWAAVTNSDGTLSTRWGSSDSKYLPHSKTRDGSLVEIISEKERKGYVYVSFVEVDENTGLMSLDFQSGNFPEPDTNPVISWEFQTPWQLPKDDSVLNEIVKWVEFDLTKRLIDEGIDCNFNLAKRQFHLDNWSITIGENLDFDLTKRRSTGLIRPEDGHRPVFFLLAVKSWFEEEIWRNSLFLAYEDSTGIGDDITKEFKLLDFFNINSIDDIRSDAEAFGLLKRLINLAQVSGAGADWF